MNVLQIKFMMAFQRIRTLLSRSPLAVVLLITFLSPGCTHLFFKPSKQLVDSPEVQRYSPRDVYFRSSDGLTLHGWYFRAKEDRGTILICHGNVENLSTHVKLDLWLIDAGYNLFIFDYRGYGRSEGTPDVKGINLDAEAALETLLFTLPRAKDGIISWFSGRAWAVRLLFTPWPTRRTRTGSRRHPGQPFLELPDDRAGEDQQTPSSDGRFSIPCPG